MKQNFIKSFFKTLIISLCIYIPTRLAYGKWFDDWFNEIIEPYLISTNILDILFLIFIIHIVMNILNIKIFIEKRKIPRS